MSNSSSKASAKKIAFVAIFAALSLIMFMVESLFPPLFLPGAKMGLSNVFSLLTLVIYGPVEATAVVAVRTVLGSFFTGNVSALMYSFTAGIASVLVSSLLTKLFHPHITLLAVSVFAAVAHNMVQLLVYCLVTKTNAIFSYMPYLALCGVLAGVIVGLAVIFIVKGVPLNTFEKMLQKNKNHYRR